MPAAQGRSLNVVELLLDRGADPDQRDSNNWTALIWAAEEDQLEVVERLKQFRSRSR
ncbi:MAG: ankyrin repeat domain-containing protein [Leptolyngbyaceae cyanobacterium SM1_3_5]|nr:ankyrin repeat domain-containing protein [Leptolyngbyaceae cyanobacterium SM1_3_5]